MFFIGLLKSNNVLNFYVHNPSLVKILSESFVAGLDLIDNFKYFSFLDGIHKFIESVYELNLVCIGLEEVGLCRGIVGLLGLRMCFFYH